MYIYMEKNKMKSIVLGCLAIGDHLRQLAWLLRRDSQLGGYLGDCGAMDMIIWDTVSYM